MQGGRGGTCERSSGVGFFMATTVECIVGGVWPCGRRWVMVEDWKD